MKFKNLKAKYVAILSIGGLMACSEISKNNDSTKVILMGPKASQIPYSHKLHGSERQDPYFWMKNRDSKEVIDHLRAENSYTEKNLQDAKPTEEILFKEFRGRTKEDESTAPYKDGEYYYFAKYEIGKEYPIYCRKYKNLQAKEEVVLDVNVLAKKEKYIQVGEVSPSPNHKVLAYAVDTAGRFLYKIRFVDLNTGKSLPDVIESGTSNFVWANDNRTIFYSQKHPETLRYEKVFRYELGSNSPKEIFFEKDEIFNVNVGKTTTDRFITLSSTSFDSAEEYFLDANNPKGEFKKLLAREEKHEYAFEDGGDGFYILTNWKAKNFRVMKTSYENTKKENWQEVVPHREDVFISQLSLFKKQIVLNERFQGLTRIHVINRNNGTSNFVQFPDPTYVVLPYTNLEYDSHEYLYIYESMVQPKTYYRFDFDKGDSAVMKTVEVPNYHLGEYMSERLWATADDGTQIPISLMYKKKHKPNGKNPVLIYGYGSYGYSLDPHFSITRLSLLDRGFAFAIAHVRGGSELGRDWYDHGRMMNKKNTFSDFIRCTEYLYKNDYADRSKIYASGGSAGGLLMGAIVNMRPDLYRGIIADVPFVDALTTMLDPSIPLTTQEYEQWGNPNDKAAYEYIKSYSPYDNVESKKYPNILAMTGYHDSQVQYWEPMKWISKIRDFNTAESLILLRTNMDAGHAGASGRFESMRETAFEYSFLLKLEGMLVK